MSSDIAKTLSEPPIVPNGAARWVSARYGDAEWSVLDNLLTTFAGPHAPNWFALASEPRARLIKTGLGRSVWYVQADLANLVVKSFDQPRGIQRVKALLLGNQARRECRACVEAVRRGIPVVRPVAVGVIGGAAGRGVFITEAVAGAEPLDSWLRRNSRSAEQTGREISVVACEVAKVFAQSHDRGFVHRDGHPGNLLVGRTPGGQPTVRYADMLGARFRRGPLGRRESVKSLAVLAHATLPFVRDSQRMRFLREYHSCRMSTLAATNEKGERKALWRDVEIARRRHAERLAGRRDRRLRGENEYFATLLLPNGWRARVALHLARRDALPIDAPDRSVQEWTAILERILDRSPELPAGLQSELSAPGNVIHRVCSTVLGSPHRREFVQSHRRRHRDVKGSLSLAYVERRVRGLVERTVLVSVRQ